VNAPSVKELKVNTITTLTYLPPYPFPIWLYMHFVEGLPKSGTKNVSYPGSKKHRTEASIRVPRMFNHTHSNNMINR
jgi:hypothetical protein